MTCDTKGFTITWFVENFSFCWPGFKSPSFLAETLDGTKWRLGFDPEAAADRIGLCLEREGEDEGPEELWLDYEISLFTVDGTPLKVHEHYEYPLGKLNQCLPVLVRRDELLLPEADVSLPQDVLTVRCRMWKRQDSTWEAESCFARTRIEVKRLTFAAVLEKFSSLVPGSKRALRVTSELTESPLVLVTLCFISERKFVFEVIPVDPDLVKCGTFKLFLIDNAGLPLKCVSCELFKQQANPEGVWKYQFSLSKRDLEDNKERYVPNDVLTFHCEVVFSTGIELEVVDKNGNVFDPMENVQRMPSVPETPNPSNTKVDHFVPPAAHIDKQVSLCNDPIPCDTVLRTYASSFPAHAAVLSNRSPVFRAMFAGGMGAEAVKCVPLPDLNPDTVRLMLHFIYTDSLPGLEWESAKSLCLAADKYEIDSLKNKCSLFLRQNINLSNVGKALVVAETLRDKDLKKAVEVFIEGAMKDYLARASQNTSQETKSI